MRKTSRIIIAAVIVAVVAVVSLFFNQIWNYSADLIANLTYDLPAEVETIAENIKLTDYGEFVFAGARPAVEDRETFNESCESHSEDVSTLGCYSSGRIHIYNITADEFAGIQESTAAHELMHAVWAHMSSSEKQELEDVILEVYADEKYHDDFAEQLETYAEDEMIEELHSRFATEIKDLPEVLETHYAKYFEDQDVLVDFYESYREPFEQLDASFQELSAELDSLRVEIEELQTEYAEKSESLSREVDEFNNCADTAGCFATDAAFNSRRNELLNEQSDLDDLYADLSAAIDEYNEKVAEYNNNILRSEELDSKVNSNSKHEEVK